MDKNLIIIYGGISSEHDVSIITALQIYSKFDYAGYKVKLVYIANNGRMYVGEKLSDIAFYKKVLFDNLKEVQINCLNKALYFVRKNKLFKKFMQVDFAINCCHGGCGENGGLSAILESAKIPCSCGDSYSMAVSMDKCFSKHICKAFKIPVVRYFEFDKKDFLLNKHTYLQEALNFKYPLIVKPARQGSSIGVCLVNNENELLNAVKLAFLYDDKIIVEKAIVNKREFNVAIVRKRDDIEASNIEEAISPSVVISFNEKYMAGGIKKQGVKNNATSIGMNNARREFPANIDEKLKSKIVEYAKRFYSAVGLNGIVRIDFIYDEVSKRLYFGEANTVPGSLGYYFFENSDIFKMIIGGSESYWFEKFSKQKSDLKAKIFN